MELYETELAVNTASNPYFTFTINHGGAICFKLHIEHKDLDKTNLKMFIDSARKGDNAQLTFKNKPLEILTGVNQIFFLFQQAGSETSIMYTVPLSFALASFEKMLKLLP